MLPGGTAEEYLQILGQLLTSCLESCQPLHVPVSEINIATQIGMLGNPTYPGFMVMKYPTDLSGRQSNIELISTKKRSQMSALIFPQRRRRNQLDSIGLTREKEGLGVLFLGLHKLMGYHEISRHWLKPSCFQHMFHTCHLKEATDTSAGTSFSPNQLLQDSTRITGTAKTTRKNHTSLFLANGADWAACLLSTSRITSGTSRTRR